MWVSGILDPLPSFACDSFGDLGEILIILVLMSEGNYDFNRPAVFKFLILYYVFSNKSYTEVKVYKIKTQAAPAVLNQK